MAPLTPRATLAALELGGGVPDEVRVRGETVEQHGSGPHIAEHDDEVRGTGHAITGIVLGSLETIVYVCLKILLMIGILKR